jgi:hypothetical protein
MTTQDVIDLDELALETMRYADQLRQTSHRLHGFEKSGERHPGVRQLYEEALDDALDAIVSHYEEEEKRPPAEDIRAARARKRLRREQPDLVDEYNILVAQERRIERWLRSAESATRARQSVLKTERELAGNPPEGSYSPPIGKSQSEEF